MTELHVVLQLVVGFVFASAFLSKLRDPRGFARSVELYDILPPHLAYAFGLLLVPAEGLVAFAHLTGRLMPALGYVGLALLALFLVAVSIDLRRGLAVSCFCFDMGHGDAISAMTAVRLSALIAAELFAINGEGVNSGTQPLWAGAPMAYVTAAYVTALCAIGIGGWVLGTPRIIDLFTRCVKCSNRATRFANNEGGL